MFRLFLTEPIHPDVLAYLRTEADVIIGDSFEPEYLAARLAEADGVILRTRGNLSHTVLAEARRLRVIGKHGVGLDNVDVAAARVLGIPVVYTPLANMQSVAEHVIGMMLTLSRNFVPSDQAIRNGDWDIRERRQPRELSEKTLGLIGGGRIGTRVGLACHHAFSMNIVYFDAIRNSVLEDSCGAQMVSLHELCREADFISVHLPLTESTRGLVDQDCIAQMKPSAYIINVARGGIVDEHALADALRAGRLAGAGIDVFATEPVPPEHPFLTLPNALLTPHTAGLSEEASRRMAQTVVDDVLRILRGQTPHYPVPN